MKRERKVTQIFHKSSSRFLRLSFIPHISVVINNQITSVSWQLVLKQYITAKCAVMLRGKDYHSHSKYKISLDVCLSRVWFVHQCNFASHCGPFKFSLWRLVLLLQLQFFPFQELVAESRVSRRIRKAMCKKVSCTKWEIEEGLTQNADVAG